MSKEADPPVSPSKELLQGWLNKIIKVKISDGRRLIGSFLCTDQEMNIILGSCQEFVYGEGNQLSKFLEIINLL
jgi:small nuclear ribonucleoprotein (snRNP)-like protein